MIAAMGGDHGGDGGTCPPPNIFRGGDIISNVPPNIWRHAEKNICSHVHFHHYVRIVALIQVESNFIVVRITPKPMETSKFPRASRVTGTFLFVVGLLPYIFCRGWGEVCFLGISILVKPIITSHPIINILKISRASREVYVFCSVPCVTHVYECIHKSMYMHI